MKNLLTVLAFSVCSIAYCQNSEKGVTTTINNYIADFIADDTVKIAAAMHPNFSAWNGGSNSGASNKETYMGSDYWKNVDVLELKIYNMSTTIIGNTAIAYYDYVQVDKNIESGIASARTGKVAQTLIYENDSWLIISEFFTID